MSPLVQNKNKKEENNNESKKEYFDNVYERLKI
jgi:hypothetical protein